MRFIGFALRQHLIYDRIIACFPCMKTVLLQGALCGAGRGFAIAPAPFAMHFSIVVGEMLRFIGVILNLSDVKIS